MSNEKWVSVCGYEGLYEVSSLGRVRSLDRIDSLGRLRRGTVLKPRVVSCGYAQVTLCDGESKRQMLVHRLVCRAFHGQPYNQNLQVDHLNKDKRDNRACNLEWVTCSENIRRAGEKPGKFKPVKRISPDGTIKRYPSIKSALADGNNSTAITRCLNESRESVKGYRWVVDL